MTFCRLVSTASALLLAASFVASPATAQPETAPPSAEQVVDSLAAALGGPEAWQATRYLHFTFAGRRTHTWDRATGRHRVEGQTQDGKNYVVLSNLDTQQGVASVEGQLVAAGSAEAAELLKLAYGAWVNDTYWLLMPYKLRDPGVSLRHDGRETIDGRTYDKLAMSFEKVGLTPGDRYWVYVDTETHLVGRWAYHLEGMKPEEPPTAWTWEGWQTYGGIQLAPMRRKVGSDRTLELSDLRVETTLPDSVFTSTAPIVWP